MFNNFNKWHKYCSDKSENGLLQSISHKVLEFSVESGIGRSNNKDWPASLIKIVKKKSK